MSKTLHEGTSFLITTDEGEIDHHLLRGSGLYYEDSRFLSRYRLFIDGQPLTLLSSQQASQQPGQQDQASEATHFLTNPRLLARFSKRLKIREQTLSVTRRQSLGRDFNEEIDIRNYGCQEAEFVVSIQFDADFENIFVVKTAVEKSGESAFSKRLITRKRLKARSGVACTIDTHGPTRSFVRQTLLRFDPKPDRLSHDRASFKVKLARMESWSLRVSAKLSADGCRAKLPEKAPRRQPSAGRDTTVLETDHAVLARAYSRSVQDMISLRIQVESPGNPDTEAIAAGIPWYMALFGRDSLIAAYQSMIADAELAQGTLTALAGLQGRKTDPASLEAPGKILHENRSEKIQASSKPTPKYPYYGSIDSTVLFLITLSEHARVTGDLAFARKMWPHAERALEWMRVAGDLGGDGLLEYTINKKTGIGDRGWKDSWDSVRFRDGKLASGPIALVEVQGYAYAAYQRIAELAGYLGKKGRARELETLAGKMKERILSLYWMEDRGFFAEALDGGKSRVSSLTSNPGHLLWCRALDAAHARTVADRLVSDEMFSGYGIRTMGKNEGGYNPISYHNGSVWPHDNSLIAFGMAQYGLHEQAGKVIEGVLSALNASQQYRFPELFTGFDRDRSRAPIDYPSACRPQAWASGAVLLLVRAILGLEVNAITRTASLDPTPISGMTYLRLKGIRLAGAEVGIEMKIKNGEAHAKILDLPSDWNRKSAA